MDKGLISDWMKEKMLAASGMDAGQLVGMYRASLKIKNNPLSEIFEKEILRRLWGGRYANFAPVR